MMFGKMAGIALSLSLIAPLLANAQSPASKELLLVIPHAAGTGVDAVGRSFAPGLQKTLDANCSMPIRPSSPFHSPKAHRSTMLSRTSSPLQG